MAEITNINNQSFNVDASIVNADIVNNPQYLPLRYNTIKYLEIVDGIDEPAYSGKAVLDNFNDTLHSSPTFNFANLYANYFNFRIQQLISPSAVTEFDASFVIDKMYTVPTSEVESDMVIEFTDIFFGTLKNKTINDPSEVAKYKTGLASDIMKNILVDFNALRETILSPNWFSTTGTIDLQFDPSTSINDIFHLAYYNNFASTTGSYTTSMFNLIRWEGDFGTNRNVKFLLEPINKRFLQLYGKLQGAGQIDVSDIVTEGFVESGARVEDSQTGVLKGSSEVTELQITLPDPETVRDSYRNTIVESVSDKGNSLIDVISIVQSLDNFYKLFCNNPNFKLDIPFDIRTLGSSETIARNARKVSAYYPEIEPGATQARLYNTILMNSKAITFTVPGQLYRRAGHFFYFQPRRESSNDKHYNNLVGFWYIVKIVHVFNGNTYQNIITAVNPFTRNN